MKNNNIYLLVAALVIGIFLMILKFVGWRLTGSNTILTDAAESIVNVIAGSFALFSLVLSFKPKDLDHPYGHGKIEFLSAGFEGGLILIAALAIWAKAGYNFFAPHSIDQIDLGIALVIFTGLVNFVLGWKLTSSGKKTNSLILTSNGAHLKTDAITSFGIVIGLGLVWITGYVWLDNVVAIIFGGIILYTGFNLIRKGISGVMDEADYDLIKTMVDTLETHRKDNWIDIHNFRVIKYGSDLHVDCHMTLPWFLKTVEAHQEVKELEDIIRSCTDNPVELFIHVDPCQPSACSICPNKSCDVRQAPFKKKIPWRVENAVLNIPHHR